MHITVQNFTIFISAREAAIELPAACISNGEDNESFSRKSFCTWKNSSKAFWLCECRMRRAPLLWRKGSIGQFLGLEKAIPPQPLPILHKGKGDHWEEKIGGAGPFSLSVPLLEPLWWMEATWLRPAGRKRSSQGPGKGKDTHGCYYHRVNINNH